MGKVVLNKDGEAILLQEEAGDDFSFGLVRHSFCCGFIDLTQVSKTHQAFYCRKCNFRFVFPIEINTWSKLKQFIKIKRKI